MSVFAHEYTHDLGLPDEYDTAGPSAANENGVNYWTLMAQSRESAPKDDSIGSRASDLGAWDKLQLGWLDYSVVNPRVAGDKVDLGPHEYNSKKAQAVVVNLPKKQVATQLSDPYAGSKSWWSGTGNDYEASMSRSVPVPASGTTTLSFQAKWNIEDCGADACDYAYVEVDPANDGTGWTAIPGSITKAAEHNGIDGSQTSWTPATFDLSPYAGKTVGLRLHYVTDPAASGNGGSQVPGLFADDIKVTNGSTPVFTSGAESTPEGWTLKGFSSVGSSVTTSYDNYLIASNRTYTSYDKYLQSGPYNFGFGSKPDYVEHFPYENGLLVNYWDTSQGDNNTSQHPGEGLILPVDANPAPIARLGGGIWRPRVSSYDSPFGLEKSDSFTLHLGDPADTASYVRGQNAVPLFHDDTPYWDSRQPTASVKVPNNGVDMRVLSQKGTSMQVKVWKRK
jgi:immune inhibitor A